MPIQIQGNVDAASGNAITFTRSGETFVIVAGVVVMAEVGNGLSDTSNGERNRCPTPEDIAGNILGDGVQLEGGQFNFVLNQIGGTITGSDEIAYYDVSNTTENFNSFEGLADGVADDGGGFGIHRELRYDFRRIRSKSTPEMAMIPNPPPSATPWRSSSNKYKVWVPYSIRQSRRFRGSRRVTNLID